MTRRQRVRDFPKSPPQPAMARSATPTPPEAFPPPISQPPEEPTDDRPTDHPGRRNALLDPCDGEASRARGTGSPAGPRSHDALAVIPAGDDPAALERARLARAKRDATGFITDALPHITADQLRWLTHRLESGDNQTACDLSGTDPYQVLTWLADPGFSATYQDALDNKREGFKTLTSHLLPSVIRAMQEVLERGNAKDRLQASTVILRAQGLMIDKTAQTDPGAVQSLFALLREEKPVEARILDITPQRAASEDPA